MLPSPFLSNSLKADWKICLSSSVMLFNIAYEKDMIWPDLQSAVCIGKYYLALFCGNCLDARSKKDQNHKKGKSDHYLYGNATHCIVNARVIMLFTYEHYGKEFFLHFHFEAFRFWYAWFTGYHLQKVKEYLFASLWSPVLVSVCPPDRPLHHWHWHWARPVPAPV